MFTPPSLAHRLCAVARRAALTPLCALLLLAPAVGCGGPSRPQGESPAEELYLQGMDALADEDFLTASDRFRAVKTKFVYTRFAALAELRLADALIAQGRYAEAIDAYQMFIQARPNHKEVPYASWKVAEGYFKQRPSDSWILPPDHERDRGATKDALRALLTYLERFPEHEQAPQARAHVLACRATLADYELYVARFYGARGELVAARGRYEVVVKAFEDVPTRWREGALELAEVYERLELKEEARGLRARLAAPAEPIEPATP